MRTEHDFLGSLEVPDDVYYGVQTMRAIENFRITGQKLDPDFIVALAQVKKAAALANMDTGRLPHEIGDVLVRAADEVIAGEMFDQFPVDPIQGGAGTSVNMNMNEVLCNRALELRGEEKGRYDIISPNNHANMAQSTNDAFPTGIKVCLSAKGSRFVASLDRLAAELERKATAYRGILKMGRTHLQDAVPITLGQEMGSYASAVRRSIRRIRYVLRHIHTINMGGTAVGTGLNAEPAYIKAVAKRLSEVTGEQYRTSQNIIKLANDFRLMASGPRCGLNELHLPMRQPGSSIMPGKVNPVIAEVLDQACYQVIAGDLAVTLAVENGQFELNVMEPVMAFNMFNSLNYLTRAVDTFVEKLLVDLTPNVDQCQKWLDNSVGIVTALLPHIGYEKSAELAREAYTTGKPIREIVLDCGLLSKKELDHILSPRQMTRPGIAE